MDLTVIPTAQLTVLEFSSNGNKGFQHRASTRVVCIHPDMTYSVQDRHSVSMVDSYAKLQERRIDRSDQTQGHCFPRKINNGVDPFVVSVGALDKLVKKKGPEKGALSI
ncbi:hypothetical protein [Endozoicomonas sp.]|uniref:hypothetical protein n=1 Tax=Endozoicomonas sp. TaxID=1892382 RepID=UPI003AF6439A